MHRKILPTLLLLALLTALVGCAPPEPVIEIVKETVVVPVTVEVTRVVTSAPLPTQPPLPTYTPVPTPDPQIAIDAYGERVIEINGMTTAALDALVARLTASDSGSDDWRADIAEHAQAIRNAYELLVALEPPPEAAAVHEQWLDGTQDYVLAVDNMEAFLDDDNVDALECSQQKMNSGLEKLTGAAEALAALMSE